jgi:glycosyltransferase involved in cell wall biosynthesis
MRLLLLTQCIAERGGTYARCFTMARGLAQRGHQVTVLAASRRRTLGTRTQQVEGVRLVESGGLLPDRFRHAGLGPLDLLTRLLFTAAERFDLVHGVDHRPTVTIPALAVARRQAVPYVADWCDLWGGEGLGATRNVVERTLLTPCDAWLETWIVGHASAATVVSKELLARAQTRRKGLDRVLLVPPAANDDLIRPVPLDQARRALSLPLDRPVLVFSGFTGLGARLLGESFASVARHVPDVLLVLIGGRQPALDRVIATAGLEGSVVRLGARSYFELGEALGCGDVMLLPYPDTMVNRAGFANKLADYLAAGRPVATNQTGDLGELVQREQVGVATADNPEAFAAGIIGLLQERELRQAMGGRARRLAETSYSYRQRAQDLEAFYLQVV